MNILYCDIFEYLILLKSLTNIIQENSFNLHTIICYFLFFFILSALAEGMLVLVHFILNPPTELGVVLNPAIELGIVHDSLLVCEVAEL